MSVAAGQLYGKRTGLLASIVYVLREYQPDASPTAPRMVYFWEVVFRTDGSPPRHALTPQYMETGVFERTYKRVSVR